MKEALDDDIDCCEHNRDYYLYAKPKTMTSSESHSILLFVVTDAGFGRKSSPRLVFSFLPNTDVDATKEK